MMFQIAGGIILAYVCMVVLATCAGTCGIISF